MDVSAILSELSDHGFGDTGTARKMAHINASYWDVLGRFPWPFLMVEGTASAAPTTGLLTGLTNIGRVLYMRYGSANMVQISAEAYYRNFAGHGLDTLSSASSEFWYQLGNSYYVYPRPTGTQSVSVLYLKRPAPLVDTDVEATILIPQAYHRLLVVGALVRLYAMEDDAELAVVFKDEYEQLLTNMASELMVKPADSPRAENAVTDNPQKAQPSKEVPPQ